MMKRLRAQARVLGLLATVSLALGCSSKPGEVPPARPSAPVKITLLYTSDEHGWVAPVTDAGRHRGGAPELLSRWKQLEGHCVPSPVDRCETGHTIALSGGDNWTGPAFSSFFKGEVAARAMHALGYAVAAFGNHELDFGREAFDRNAQLEGFPYVAANVVPARDAGGVAEPFVLVRRSGVTVGVVGLATHETVRSGLRENYVGLSFGDEEEALLRAVPAAYDAGADAVVVIGHVCAKEFHPIVAKHPEWRLAFVGAGHCHRLESMRVFNTPIVETGSFLRNYARISLEIDPARASRDRVVSFKSESIDLTYPEGSTPPVEPDAELSQLVSYWQRKTDEALGEVVGYADARLDPDKPLLTNFLTDSWREETGADVAILNRYGTRQSILPGPINLQSIYSVLPFNNQIMLVQVTGEQLKTDVTCCKAHVSGVQQREDGTLVMADGSPIDPQRRYSVAVTDYIYSGGSGFTLEAQDSSPKVLEDWRQPVIRWLRKHPTSPGKGLETLVDARPRLRD